MIRTVRGICVFLLAVLLIQGAALLVLTPAGLEKIHPFFVRVHAEKFDPSTNTYAVYYDTRVEVAAADLIVVGIDGNVAESYDLLGHFTRFVKQYSNYSAVMMNLSSSQRMLANSLLAQNEESRFDKRLEAMRENTGMTEDFTDYFTELYIINRTMTEERKFDILSYSEQFITEEAPQPEMTGDEWAAAVAQSCEETSRSAICVVDSRLLEQTTGFASALREQLADKNIMFVQAHYDNTSASAETHRACGFPLTFGESGVYFVDNEKSAGFYSYYDNVTLIPGAERDMEDPLDTRYTDYYFVVSGGTQAE